MPCTAAKHVADKVSEVPLGVRRAGGRGPVAPGVFVGDRCGGGGHMRERTTSPKGHLRARVAPPPPHSSPPAPAPMTSLIGGALLPGTCGWVWRGGAPSRGETRKISFQPPRVYCSHPFPPECAFPPVVPQSPLLTTALPARARIAMMEAAFMVTRKEEWGEREAPWRREEGGEEREKEKEV